MEPIRFDDPILIFSEASTVTGADSAWLRTFIQRDKTGALSTKHRSGRLMFSLRNVANIAILWGLNARVRTAPAAAWAVIDAFGDILAGVDDLANSAIHVAMDGDSVLIWTIDTDGVISTWSDWAHENQFKVYEANQAPHVIIPAKAILGPIAAALKIAHEAGEQ